MPRKQWSIAALLSLTAPHLTLAHTLLAQPLSAKVQETLMGPRIAGRGPVAYISEDGNHLAIVAPKGSRQVMLIDGVEGPAFDEIPLDFWSSSRQPAASIVFSPTGGRSAYVGRRGGDHIAVVDGKEAVTLSTPETLRSMPGAQPAGWTFLFSRDGSRLAYAAQEVARWVMITDGVKGPAFVGIDFTQAVLKGKRLVYVAQTVDQKWHVVVDGKPGPGYDEIKELEVTADGAHYAFIAVKRSTGPGGAASLAMMAVVDGVEGAREQEVSDLEQAPDGRVAYMAMRPPTPGAGGNPPHLIAGGLDLTWTTTFATEIRAGPGPQHHVAWSPDGKRFATVQRNDPNPGVTVLVNGKPMGPTYQSANLLMWSPDGSRLAYQGRSPNGGTFLVLDGEESSGYNAIQEFRWSPDGKRYAYSGTNSAGYSMIVDGKEQPKAMAFGVGSLRFSPDSKHIGYAAQTSVTGYQPMVDGALKPHTLGSFATRVQGNLRISIPQFFFSPDGSRLAYVGTKPDGSGKTAVWVDGVAHQGPMPGYFHPAWSPDGKHFAAVISNGSGQGWTIMVDGKLGPNFEDILVLNEASAGFVTPSTFRYYAFKGTEIYRVTLELGP